MVHVALAGICYPPLAVEAPVALNLPEARPDPDRGHALDSKKKVLPSGVEYTFVRAILDAFPPVRETAVWVNADATAEILTAFNEGTYGTVDRLLRRHERTLVQPPENERDTGRALRRRPALAGAPPHGRGERESQGTW